MPFSLLDKKPPRALQMLGSPAQTELDTSSSDCEPDLEGGAEQKKNCQLPADQLPLLLQFDCSAQLAPGSHSGLLLGSKPQQDNDGSSAGPLLEPPSSEAILESTPWFSTEERKAMDEEFEELFPTYRLNSLEPEPAEPPEEKGQEGPAPKKRRTEPWVGLPPNAFLGFSSSLGARASMLLTGSSAFAMGAACKQALFGSLEKDLLSARYSEQLPVDIRLVTKAALDRIARTPGMHTFGSEDSAPAAANELIQKKVSQCEFYVGISERPVERFQEHQSSGYSEMHIMVFPDSQASGNMEKSLITTWQQHPHCMNAGPGGLRASAGKPHFCYIVFRTPGLKR